MTARDWQTLRDWLFRVFPADDARESLADQVATARDAGIDVPATIAAEVDR